MEIFTGSSNINVTIPRSMSSSKSAKFGLSESRITADACRGITGGRSWFPAISRTRSVVTTINDVSLDTRRVSRNLMSLKFIVVRFTVNIRPFSVPPISAIVPLSRVKVEVTFCCISAFWNVIAPKLTVLPFTGSLKYKIRRPLLRSTSNASSIGGVVSSTTSDT